MAAGGRYSSIQEKKHAKQVEQWKQVQEHTLDEIKKEKCEKRDKYILRRREQLKKTRVKKGQCFKRGQSSSAREEVKNNVRPRLDRSSPREKEILLKMTAKERLTVNEEEWLKEMDLQTSPPLANEVAPKGQDGEQWFEWDSRAQKDF